MPYIDTFGRLSSPDNQAVQEFEKLKKAMEQIKNVAKLLGITEEVEMPYRQRTSILENIAPKAKLTAQDLAISRALGQTTIPGTNIPLTEEALRNLGMWQETPSSETTTSKTTTQPSTTPTTATTSAQPTIDIPFKPGLTQQQKDSIINLVKNKPDPATWTATDIANWNYATNNAPLPKKPTSTTPTTTSPSTTPTTSTPQKQFYRIGQDIYEAGTNRYISATEWEREWSGRAVEVPPPPNVSTSISATPSPTITAQDIEARRKAAHDICNNSNLPPEMKMMCNLMVDTVDIGKLGLGFDKDISAMIEAFNKIKTTQIDPYYRQLADFFKQTIQDQYQTLLKERELEKQEEEREAKETIRKAKESFEKAGLTFSGEAIRQLGEEAAYSAAGQAVMPKQKIPEGLIPQKLTRIATSSQARYEESLRDLGRKAEEYLGTEEVKKLGIPYTPVGGITGELETKKQKEYGETLRDILDQYLARRQMY
jgi:hypothetical protein